MKSRAISNQTVHTTEACQLIDVTDSIRQVVREQKLTTGMAIIYVPHTTAALTINENADPDVQHDILLKLQTLIPRHETYYRHGEGNSDAHVKTSLVGNSVMVLIEEGRLLLGQWQGIYFCEFDGPRTRRMILKLVDFAGE